MYNRKSDDSKKHKTFKRNDENGKKRYEGSKERTAFRSLVSKIKSNGLTENFNG